MTFLKPLCELNDFPEFLWTFGPNEWSTAFIVLSDNRFKEHCQLTTRFVGSLLKTLFGLDTEEAFYQVGPRRVLWSRVTCYLWMPREPFHGGSIIMRVEIIQDHAEALPLILMC